MDYEEAVDRLDKPRRQDTKNIGYKLQLFRLRHSTVETKGMIGLSYYNKTIIRWSEDGSIQLGLSNYEFSSRAVNKVNEYLPAGWRLIRLNLRHKGRSQHVCTGVVTVRNPQTGELLRSMPYGGDDAIYTAAGRKDLGHPVSYYLPRHPRRLPDELEAGAYFERVAVFVEDMVEALLRGELSWRKRELNTAAYQAVNERIMTLDLIERMSKEIPEKRKWMDEVHLFWKENYPFTTKAKSQKALVDQLAHKMRTGIEGVRPRTSDLRLPLKYALEEFILSESGFSIAHK